MPVFTDTHTLTSETHQHCNIMFFGVKIGLLAIDLDTYTSREAESMKTLAHM